SRWQSVGHCAIWMARSRRRNQRTPAWWRQRAGSDSPASKVPCPSLHLDRAGPLLNHMHPVEVPVQVVIDLALRLHLWQRLGRPVTVTARRHVRFMLRDGGRGVAEFPHHAAALHTSSSPRTFATSKQSRHNSAVRRLLPPLIRRRIPHRAHSLYSVIRRRSSLITLTPRPPGSR